MHIIDIIIEKAYFTSISPTHVHTPPLSGQNEELHRNESTMDGQKSKDIAHMLQNATDQTSSLYGNDVKTSYQLISWILHYESQQQGFNLAAMRDAKFNEVRFTASSLPFSQYNLLQF